MNYQCETILKVQSFIDKFSPDLLASDASIVLAVSGGPDSMAMLDILSYLKKPYPFNLIVAHLNHCLRGDESDQDELFILNQCQNRQINCITKRTDIKKLAQQTSQSIETAARNARYEFLSEICRDHNCKYLATAHHADDNAETILHRIIRGTGINGLAGIQPKRFTDSSKDITIIRPLLHVSRCQIEQYLAENNIPYRNDSSNNSNNHTRNSLRNKLIPEIENSFNPNFKQALNNLGTIAAHASQLLNDIAREDIKAANAIITNGLFKIKLEHFTNFGQNKACNILRYAIEQIGMPMSNLGIDQITNIYSECLNHNSRIIAHLPANWTAEISDSCLIIASILPTETKPQILSIPGETDIENLFSLSDFRPINSVSLEPVYLENFHISEFRKNKLPNQEIIDLDKTSGSIMAAPLKPGLKFQPLGLKGSQTTGDIMTNHKVPQYLRSHIASICDDTGIICIPGLRIADKVKVTPKTKSAAMISFKMKNGHS